MSFLRQRVKDRSGYPFFAEEKLGQKKIIADSLVFLFCLDKKYYYNQNVKAKQKDTPKKKLRKKSGAR